MTPEGIHIRLAGDWDLQPNQECGQVIYFPQTVEGFTLFNRGDINNASSLIVGEVLHDRSLHTHLDWIIESDRGMPNAPTGAYMMELQLITQIYPTCFDPFLIMFNNVLAFESFSISCFWACTTIKYRYCVS